MLITVRDASLDPVAYVQNHDMLEWTQRWLDVGGWQLQIPTRSDEADALLQPGAGIVVTDDNGQHLLSGPVVASLAGDAQAATRTVQISGGIPADTLTIVGTDDMVWLRDRIVIPPATFDTDDRAGVGSTVIVGYINANTAAARAIPGLAAITDPVVGAAVTMSARYDVLLDTCREAALLAGIGFTLAQVDRTLELELAAPADLTDEIRFGLDLHNLTRAVVSTSAAAGTVAYVAGQGEGAARDIVEVGTPAGRRIERFLDRRDLATTGQLSAVGQVWLDENAGALSIDADPVTAEGAVYGSDYRLGDLVAVDIDGVVTPQQVAAVTTSVTGDGLTRTLTLGAGAQTGVDRLLRAQAALGGRVSLVERR